MKGKKFLKILQNTNERYREEEDLAFGNCVRDRLFLECKISKGRFHVGKEKKETEYLLPRRVLAQTAKTQGGTLEVPAYGQDYFTVAEII